MKQMFRKIVFFFMAVLAFAFSAKADNVVFRASAPDAVVQGEQFRLTYTVNAEGRDLRAKEPQGFDVLMGPSQSTSYSSSWVNGKSSSETSVSYTYILVGNRTGKFNIPAATIKVKGATYTSNALTINVLPPDKSSSQSSGSSSRSNSSSRSASVSNDRLFVTMNVSKRDVYEQEGILVTFKVYSLENFQISDLKYPEFEGFLVQEIELPQQKQLTLERHNGRNYESAVMRQVVLYPQHAGQIVIKQGRFDATVRIRMQSQGGGSIFDDFFDTYRDVNKTLTTAPVTINVRPLPSGKPASFNGSVGSFSMTSQLSSNNVKTNDAVTLRIKISGNGNVKLIKNPEVKFPNDFDVYDPKVTSDIRTTTAGVSGSKTIEYMAIPRYAGDFDIPAVEFSYFDIASHSYKTVRTQPYKLHVEKGKGGGSGSVVSNFNNKESLKYLGKDIRYLKTGGFHFIQKNDLFYGSLLYMLWYLIPAILFVIFFVIYRKQVKENANIALVRTKKANKTAVRRLKNAGKLMRDGKKEEFYDEVLRALWGYLSDKLSIPQAELTKDNVEAELSKYGVDENLINEFMDILNTCEFARYAPSQASDAMDKLYELTVDAIGKMENTIKK